MESFNNFVVADKITENQVFVNSSKSRMLNSSIEFRGKSNILFVEDGVVLKNSRIIFNHNNSVVYLSKSRHVYILKCFINNNSVLYFGKDCYFNDTSHMRVLISESKNVIVGDEGLFSFGIWLRTADPHLLYDIESRERINYSKSIFIGDHVWIGQQSLILKGTQIGSGSVLGGGTVVSNKRIPSNTVWGGNPARQIRSNVFFSDESVHAWTDVETKQFEHLNTDQWIYTKTEDTVDMNKIDLLFQQQVNSKDRLDMIRNLLVADKNKNRFFIENNRIVKKLNFWNKLKMFGRE